KALWGIYCRKNSLSLITTPAFLEKWDALSLISRQKRSNAGDEETELPANLERECLEEVCDYEEARQVLQDNYRTVNLNGLCLCFLNDIFWSVYIDGDQCAVQPCENGAMCSHSVISKILKTVAAQESYYLSDNNYTAFISTAMLMTPSFICLLSLLLSFHHLLCSAEIKNWFSSNLPLLQYW
uniref:Gla domain-containing protein n=1 Tax=Cyprinus carpio TaxID=7962 RepID=A0A8C2DMB0_CYPCA